MEVLIDQAREHDVVAERSVDHIRFVATLLHDLVERADRDDATLGYRDGVTDQAIRAHRVDPACREDGDHGIDGTRPLHVGPTPGGEERSAA
jgi:hypothetical protein